MIIHRIALAHAIFLLLFILLVVVWRLTIFNLIRKLLHSTRYWHRILPKPFIKLLLVITRKVNQGQLLLRKVVKPLFHIDWELISFLLNHVQRFNWNLPAPSMSFNIIELFCFTSVIRSYWSCGSGKSLQKRQPCPWLIVNIGMVSSEQIWAFTVSICDSPQIRLKYNHSRSIVNCLPKAVPKNFEANFINENLLYWN